MDSRHRTRDAVLSRARASKKARERVLQLVRAGRPLEAEPDQNRKIRRIAERVGVSRSVAAQIARGTDLAELNLDPERLMIAQTVVGSTVDILPIAFLERARRAANAVGHLVKLNGTSVGTCFMISPRLLITNNHVIESVEVAKRRRVEFNFEKDVNGDPLPVATFALDPDTFFVTDDSAELDFTVVALGDPVGTTPPVERTFCKLSGRNDKHALGNFVNIIQHPDGGPKKIVVRENHLVDRPRTPAGTEPVLQYMADTRKSSSGSPVFNDEWHVVGLHHKGVDAGEITICGEQRPDVVNEAARASFIVEALKAASGLTAAQQALLDEALAE